MRRGDRRGSGGCEDENATESLDEMGITQAGWISLSQVRRAIVLRLSRRSRYGVLQGWQNKFV